MERRTFMRLVTAGGACLGGSGTTACGQGCTGQDSGKQCRGGATMRPYQLLCAMCAIGREGSERNHEKLSLIRENPDLPLTLVCNAGDVFAYQDPGPAEDRDGSAEFNRMRDLEILQRLDLAPGVTLPARIILHRLWDRIESVSGICYFEGATSAAWKGCPLATDRFYKKGRESCLSLAVPSWRSQLNFSAADLDRAKDSRSLIVPRTKEERAEAKKKSLEAMRQAGAIPVRPTSWCAPCASTAKVPGLPTKPTICRRCSSSF
jgi:hypothetical protein